MHDTPVSDRHRIDACITHDRVTLERTNDTHAVVKETDLFYKI